MKDDAQRHEEVEQLLPWYVNGTLAAAEREELEAHLAGCPRCRAEAAREEGLAAALREAEEVAPAPHPAQLARLLARLDAPAREERAPRRWLAGERLRALAAATPAPVRWAFAAQAILVVALAGGAGWTRWNAVGGPAAAAAPAAEFRTLSDAAPPAAAAGGTRLRVVFADETPERDLRAILRRVGGQIVDGPSPLGVYTVVVPAGPAADPLEVVLDHLRAQPEVRFASPVPGGGP